MSDDQPISSGRSSSCSQCNSLRTRRPSQRRGPCCTRSAQRTLQQSRAPKPSNAFHPPLRRRNDTTVSAIAALLRPEQEASAQRKAPPGRARRGSITQSTEISSALTAVDGVFGAVGDRVHVAGGAADRVTRCSRQGRAHKSGRYDLLNHAQKLLRSRYRPCWRLNSRRERHHVRCCTLQLRALRRRARQSLPSGTSYPPYSDGQTNAPCAEALHCAAVIFCGCCVSAAGTPSSAVPMARFRPRRRREWRDAGRNRSLRSPRSGNRRSTLRGASSQDACSQ